MLARKTWKSLVMTAMRAVAGSRSSSRRSSLEQAKFSAVEVDFSSRWSRLSGMPCRVSSRRMHSASLISSPGPWPPERMAGVSGWARRYSAAFVTRLRRIRDGVSPLTPAPKTITASAGRASFS